MIRHNSTNDQSFINRSLIFDGSGSNLTEPFYKVSIMRILFVTSTRIGDAILSTGVLHYLIEKYPKASVTIVCGRSAATLFSAVPGLERVIILDKMLLSMHWVYLWLNCIGHFWDILVDLRNAPLTYILPAKKTYRLFRSRRPEHRVQTLGHVLKIGNSSPSPHVWVAERHRKDAARLVPSGAPILAVGPTANWRGKQWRADRFIQLIQRLTSSEGILCNAYVIIFGREDERPTALKVIDSIPADRCIDLVGRVDLLTAFACLERSSFYVGNDSGLMHLAAASGVPTLGLFGPSPEACYAPWGSKCVAIRGPLPFDKIFPKNFDHRSTDTLMDGLSVSAVEQEATKLWKNVYKDLL